MFLVVVVRFLAMKRNMLLVFYCVLVFLYFFPWFTVASQDGPGARCKGFTIYIYIYIR